jgi:murein DD-endopeptidase MepM/ murein hydrolase activator NlpD
VKLTRRGLILSAAGGLTACALPETAPADSPSLETLSSEAAGPAPLLLKGQWRQGGFAIGRTLPRLPVYVDGEVQTTTSERGLFIVGFDRDAPATTRIDVGDGSARSGQSLNITPGTFPSTRIDGLPPSTVEPTDPALLARIQREAALKAEGFASRADADDFREGFAWPLAAYRISSAWGAQRVLNGTPARPHYGIDLAAPQGTPILSPAAGIVSFARTGLHFEGGLVLIDHGQGLISAYLHQSRINVVAGQRLNRGEVIGQVGREGRATGPHLCWRMKWRDRYLDPSLMVGFSEAELV